MTAIDTSLPSLTIVKSFTYRGEPHEWSNTYFMTGDLPSSPASWKTLADAVIADEKTLYASTTKAVRAIGHQAGESVAVWSYDYEAMSEEVAGTFAGAHAEPAGGDTANWIRWSTDQLTSRGKPIYLRSYYHPAYWAGLVNPDTTDTDWAAAAQDFGDAWIAGYDDGDSVVHHRAGPHGVVGLVATPSTNTTTRTLDRRGRRPTTP
jgi:hypothetical protein